jgi:uncharacterized membrane protein
MSWMGVTWMSPVWLLLMLPVAVMLVQFPGPTRVVRFLRWTLAMLVVMAMAGPSVLLPGRGGAIIVLADKSASMPGEAGQTQLEMVTRVQKEMSAGDVLGVVSFGEGVGVDRMPGGGPFGGFTAEPGRGGSALGEAIEAGLALAPLDMPARVVVISDGRYTGRDPVVSAVQAADRGVPVDFVRLARPVTQDVAVRSITAPGQVYPGEGFLIDAVVQMPQTEAVQITLMRGKTAIAAGRQTLNKGNNRLSFRDRLSMPGVAAYTLTVTPEGVDPTPENNRARVIVGVKGNRPVLVVTGSEKSDLAGLLAEAGVVTKTVKADEFDGSLTGLAGASAIVIENVSARKLGRENLERMAGWVTEAGGAVALTGGKQSFGLGGYYKSPLEAVLPVTMELRKETRKTRVAMVIALDRSGSMTAPTGDGRTKMDLANRGTAQVVDMLADSDELGVMAVDTEAHVVGELKPLGDARDRLRGDVLSIRSQGGGIFIYEALKRAARMVSESNAATRHIILFADAADSEEPGNYQELMDKLATAGVTVSVIGLGDESDPDAGLLKDIAARGNGRIFFTRSAQELPSLFAQDTITVARSTFVDEATAILPGPGLLGMTRARFENLPQIGGYNLAYLRDEASLGILTGDENKSAVLSMWQAGLGRSMAFTGEVSGKYSGELAKWGRAGELYGSMARWLVGSESALGEMASVTQELKGNVAVVRLYLDPERAATLVTGRPYVTVLSSDGVGVKGAGVAGLDKEDLGEGRVMMRYVTPDMLEAEVGIVGDQTLLATAVVPGVGSAAMPPVCLAYSPEFAPMESDPGLDVLGKVAQITGGVERSQVDDIWKSVPRVARYIAMSPWLFCLAVVLFLLEVLERRTGLTGMAAAFGMGLLQFKWPVWKRGEKKGEEGVKANPEGVAGEVAAVMEVKKEGVVKEARGDGAGGAAEGGMAGALDKAREAAKKRKR